MMNVTSVRQNGLFVIHCRGQAVAIGLDHFRQSRFIDRRPAILNGGYKGRIDIHADHGVSLCAPSPQPWGRPVFPNR